MSATFSFFSSIESGLETEPEPFELKEFILHHVKDHVVVPINIAGFDLSITQHVIMLGIAAAFLMVFIPLIIRSKSIIPRGPANLIEWVVVFLRESVIEPILGAEGNRYTPHLLTVFFFIITCNLLGLVPMGATPTSSISVTLTLALLTFLFVQLYSIRKHGLKGYFHIFLPSGLPAVLRPLIFFVEVLSMCTKHLALAIRLFANMFAGHLVTFTVLGLVFLFKNYFIAPLPILGIVGLSILEIVISLIQAYIFTILSAVFISMAIQIHH